MFVGDYQMWMGYAIRMLLAVLIIAILSLPLLQFFLT